MSVASPAEGLAAAQHLPCLFPALDVGWHVGAPSSRPVRANTRASGSGGQSDCCDRRQSERPGGAKSRALRDPVGSDGAKKVKGVKYHIAVDTLGLLVNVAVHAADRQDRDGLPCVLSKKTRALFPFIEVIFADGGYQGPVAAANIGHTGTWSLEIVKRSDQTKGFVVLPKRWIVERTLSWLSRCRRLVRHDEQYLQTSVAFIRLAMIRLMLRRLARQ